MTITAAQVARAAGIGPRTSRFVMRDESGCPYDGGRTDMVLATLARADRTDLPAEMHTVAYAVRKSLVTARMGAVAASRLRAMSPYQVCALVARVAVECPETTTGGICDGWLPGRIGELTADVQV